MRNPSPALQSSRVITRSPVYYGWVILIVGTLGVIMSSPGQTYSFSVFIEEFIRDLGLTRTSVSGLYTVGTITGSLMLPYIGRLIDKHGSRRMVVLIALGFGLACVYMSTVSTFLMLGIGFVFMRMLGQSSITIVSRNVMNQWWVRRRGFVLSISTLVAATLGSGTFPGLIKWLIPQFGWRMTYVILGVAVMAIMMPIGYLFFRDRPELFGLFPDGLKNQAEADALDKVAKADVVLVDAENWTAQEAMKTRTFWIIALSIAASSMLGTGLTFHIVSIFQESGLSDNLAAAIFFPMALTTAIMSIPFGWLIDRVEAKYLVVAGLVILTIVIIFSGYISSPTVAIIYGIVFGLGNAFDRVVSNVIWANYFGRPNLGAISGATMTIGAAASGLGPLVYGVGFDLSGSYRPSLWLSTLYPVIMIVLVLTVRRPTKRKE
jgi:MFS family permease